MIRILVVDDEPMVCAHLRTILGSAPDLDVVDQAHDGAAAVEAVIRYRPDVVLLDLRMPGVDGLAAIERLTRLPVPPVIVVLTTFDADHDVTRALRAGAAGFLVKSTPPQDLIGLVRVDTSPGSFSSWAVRTAPKSASSPSTSALSEGRRADRVRDVGR
ncbi:hypothetical protein GCM10020369_14150 [Cryptosporangium minutisporangium]|uniref:Response regulatory domain-containing protein n=1 Tax=Cryptosporangium minutisporangium TaxID=113569 RepID=A0ABP6SUK2_9ACTN